jgi:hypothetical protein
MDSEVLERLVWDAIAAVLDTRGDVDVRAGLSWLEPDDQRAVARAAIDVVMENLPAPVHGWPSSGIVVTTLDVTDVSVGGNGSAGVDPTSGT